MQGEQEGEQTELFAWVDEAKDADITALEMLLKAGQATSIGGRLVDIWRPPGASLTMISDFDLTRERIRRAPRQSGKTAATALGLAPPNDPPFGDIRWLIERPVTIFRDGHRIEAPLIVLSYLSVCEFQDMPSGYERRMIAQVLHIGNGVHLDYDTERYTFAEEF